MEILKRERINKILENSAYRNYLKLNEEAEKGRKFCRHNMAHYLDVARIAQILNLREAQHVEDELIYAAALLHDIGRHEQYEEGTPHEKAGERLSLPILKECGYHKDEIAVILRAIRNHRTEEAAEKSGLCGLLYRADKLSRSCFACEAEPDCDWKYNKKNMHLTW